MRRFTRCHRVLSLAFPACLGGAVGLLLPALLSGTYWLVGPAMVLLAAGAAGACLRFRARRRFLELERAARQRGWRNGRPDWLLFQEDEVRELGRIEGRLFEEVFRAVSTPNFESE